MEIYVVPPMEAAVSNSNRELCAMLMILPASKVAEHPATPQDVRNLPQSYAKRVKLKFTLEQAMKAQRGSRGIALLFL
jgi:hypothetical protein